MSSVFPTLFCTTLKFYGPILRFLIYFELIFLQSEKCGSSFSFIHVDNQFSQKQLLNTSFLYSMFLVSLSKTR
jgi:hypothetical protein